MNVALKECVIKKYFTYLSTKTYIVGTQKNRLSNCSFEHPKQMFKLMDKKIFSILRSKILFVHTPMACSCPD